MRPCVLVHSDKLLRPLCVSTQCALEEGVRDLAAFFLGYEGLWAENA